MRIRHNGVKIKNSKPIPGLYKDSDGEIVLRLPDNQVVVLVAGANEKIGAQYRQGAVRTGMNCLHPEPLTGKSVLSND